MRWNPAVVEPLEPMVVPGVDLALSLDATGWAFEQVRREAIEARVSSRSAVGWSVDAGTPEALGGLVRASSTAWIVQRPGCGGLTTRVVLLDDHGRALASVWAARDGDREPMAWRRVLLMALLADGEATHDA